METQRATTFTRHLNATYFDDRLSPGVLTYIEKLEEERDEVRNFAERLSRLFREAGIEATDVPVTFGRALQETIPHVLPGAWNGIVPPITFPNRHVRIDRYLSGNRWCQPETASTFLDLGCGFPPITSVDTAERFPHWFIIAIDRAYWPYMIIDADGNRGVFDVSKMLRYFQPRLPGPTTWRNILREKEATRARFTRLLEDLMERLPVEANHEITGFEHDGARLILNPVREYARPNLRFQSGDLGTSEFPKADLARCFNVLTYFDGDFRRRVLRNVSSSLREGGIFITGSDWAETMAARYFVYRKEEGELVAREFAMTLDHLRGSTHYFSLHDDNEESKELVRAVSALRSNADFFGKFSRRFDALHEQHGVCPRGSDGYLGDIPDMPGDELIRRNVAIMQTIECEGFVEHAVSALNEAGFEAWRNEAGHLAFFPVPERP